MGHRSRHEAHLRMRMHAHMHIQVHTPTQTYGCTHPPTHPPAQTPFMLGRDGRRRREANKGEGAKQGHAVRQPCECVCLHCLPDPELCALARSKDQPPPYRHPAPALGLGTSVCCGTCMPRAAANSCAALCFAGVRRVPSTNKRQPMGKGTLRKSENRAWRRGQWRE